TPATLLILVNCVDYAARDLTLIRALFFLFPRRPALIRRTGRRLPTLEFKGFLAGVARLNPHAVIEYIEVKRLITFPITGFRHVIPKLLTGLLFLRLRDGNHKVSHGGLTEGFSQVTNSDNLFRQGTTVGLRRAPHRTVKLLRNST